MIEPVTPVRVNIPGSPFDGQVGTVLPKIDEMLSPFETFFLGLELDRPVVMFLDDLEPLSE